MAPFTRIRSGSHAIGGSMLAHRELGGGAWPVLFVHGLFGRGRDLEPFAEAVLGEDPQLRGLIPDLLAHGDSPQLPRQADLSVMADALAQWLDDLGVKGRVPVVAHSMGGRIVLRLHERFPDRLGPFVFLDTPAGIVAEKRSPLSPFLRALALAPDHAATKDVLLEPFARVMMGPTLEAWMHSRVVQTARGFGWNFDREALVEYRNNTLREELWPVVEALGGEHLTLFVPKLSVYVRREERDRYAAAGVDVQVLAGARHDLYATMPPASMTRIRRLLRLSG